VGAVTTVRRLPSISDRLRSLERDKAIGGRTGPTGGRGTAGNDGSSAVVTVGTTTTGAPGSNAAVTNTGTASAAVLNFTIPRGATGPQGAAAYIDVRDYGGSPGASAATNTTALQSAIAQANTVKMPLFLAGGTWAINAGAVTIPQRFAMFGAGRDVTTISVSGTGTAFASPTPGTRIFDWNLSGFTVSTSTAAIAFDCDSLSTSVFRDIKVSGFSDVGFYLHSTDPGGSVYNRWFNVSVQSTPTGYRLRANSSNANVWNGCRAANCSGYGWDIQDSNDNTITASQAEVCGTGVSVNAAGAGTSSWNRFTNMRVEACTTGISVPSSNVANTVIEGLWADGSTATPINDSGTTTRRVGQYFSARTTNSIVQLDSGWSFVSGASITLGTASSSIQAASANPLYLRGNAADAAAAVGVWLGNGNVLTPGTDRRIVGFSRDTPVVHASPVAYIDSNGAYEFAPSGVRIQCGTGTPEGNVPAPVGSLYLRSDGGAASSVYLKESGTGATGWAVTTAAATVAVGTTTTGAPGSNASVTNSGTSSAMILDFTIPRGAGYTWRGVWVSGTSYAVNDVITWQSHTYVCVTATATTTAPTTVTTTPFALMVQGLAPRQTPWSAGSTYYPGDAVISGSHTYVQTFSGSCTGAGTAPPATGNNSWWTQLSLGLLPRGAYSAVVAYNPGDVVNYQGYGFAAVVAATGTAPTVGSDTAVWKRLVDKGDTGGPGTLAITTVNYLSSGNYVWTVPANLEWVRAMAVAAGGGGGGTAPGASGVAQGAGGGGGGYAEVWLSGSAFAAKVGANVNISIGGGGAGGVGASAGTGGTGGNTSFGASGETAWYMVCTGGTGGQGMTAAAGVQINNNGVGGSVSVLPAGGLGINGEDGQHARTVLNGSTNISTYLLNGGGGASHMSAASLGGDSYGGQPHAGQLYGGGGGGGISNTSAQDGGQGGTGMVRVVYATRS
jgi:hypothetical protein